MHLKMFTETMTQHKHDAMKCLEQALRAIFLNHQASRNGLMYLNMPKLYLNLIQRLIQGCGLAQLIEQVREIMSILPMVCHLLFNQHVGVQILEA